MRLTDFCGSNSCVFWTPTMDCSVAREAGCRWLSGCNSEAYYSNGGWPLRTAHFSDILAHINSKYLPCIRPRASKYEIHQLIWYALIMIIAILALTQL